MRTKYTSYLIAEEGTVESAVVLEREEEGQRTGTLQPKHLLSNCHRNVEFNAVALVAKEQNWTAGSIIGRKRIAQFKFRCDIHSSIESN